jgi:hypothetical protein
VTRLSKSPGELPALTGGFKKINSLKGHKLKVIFQRPLTRNYRLISYSKVLSLFLMFKILHCGEWHLVAVEGCLQEDSSTGRVFLCLFYPARNRGFHYFKNRMQFGARVMVWSDLPRLSQETESPGSTSRERSGVPWP